jgi:hypothetical protein
MIRPTLPRVDGGKVAEGGGKVVLLASSPHRSPVNRHADAVAR